jgi:hypothetical protein
MEETNVPTIFQKLLRHAWTTSPRELAGKIALKLKGGPSSPREMFNSIPNANDLTRHWINFVRTDLAAQNRLKAWKSFDFKNKVFMEIGCGLTAGLAPLALFLGARHVYGVEPQWIPGLVQDDHVRDQYYIPLWKLFCSVYGEHMSLEKFLVRLDHDLTVHAGPIETARFDEKIDLVWSLSCLEHIANFSVSMERLAELCSTGCTQMHVVDFGNHQSKETPFKGLFDFDPGGHPMLANSHINLLRHPDIVAEFERHAMPCQHLVVDKRAVDISVARPYWLEKYKEQDLEIRVAAYFIKSMPELP